MDPLLLEYLRAMQARKLSPETIRTTRSVLGGLRRHAEMPLTQLTAEDIADWQADTAGRVSARTLRKDVSAVRAFFTWARAEGRVRRDPTARMRAPKVPRLLPRPVPEARLALAMSEADDRMRLILALAAFAGLRAGEVASLSWTDVSLDGPEPTLRVTGKGSAERVVDISPDLAALLVALPRRRGPVVRRGDGAPGHNTANTISKLANDHLRGLNIPDTLHSLRHRFGTEVCRVGGLRQAQEALGHASPTTTAGYARVARRDIRSTIVSVGHLLDG